MKYQQLHPLDLVQILKPGQLLELSCHQFNEHGNLEQISLKTILNSFYEQTIIIDLPFQAEPWFKFLRPGKVVTIETGRNDGCTCFKSRVLRQHQHEKLQLILERPMVMTSKERRTEPRIPFVMPLTYQIISFHGRELPHLNQKISYGESINLSKNGMTFQTNLELPISLIILIEFNFAGEKLSLTGIIRRTHASTIGVQFLQPSRDGREFIKQLILKQKSAPLKFI